MFKVSFPCLVVYVDVINKDLQELVCPIFKFFSMVWENILVVFFSSNNITF
jgi:hypothetical protein